MLNANCQELIKMIRDKQEMASQVSKALQMKLQQQQQQNPAAAVA
jgi:hypothetical protein